MAANVENLIPANKRSKEEARENARKGGIKSGETRRKQREMKKWFTTVLNGEYRKKNGEKISGYQAIAENIMAQAVDPKNRQAYKNIEMIFSFIDEDKKRHEKRELAEIERIKAETEQIKAKTELMSGGFGEEEIEDDGFIEALRESAKSDWDEE